MNYGKIAYVPPIITLNNLSKIYATKYQKVTALDQVDLDVYAGEMVAVMGPSGSGKSTLMNVIGLLDRPSEGELTIEGTLIDLDMSDQRIAQLRSTKIGFVFQSYNLLPRLSALQNVLLPVQYSKMPKAKERARELLKQVGLEARMDHRPNQLSGGENQRVAIARALINDPTVILADEPTGNLDSKSGGEILYILRELNLAGKTILIVTHDQYIANECQRTVRLFDGKLVREETEEIQHD